MVVDCVKTDAMFGCGKPRLRVQAGAIPDVSEGFDVTKFIRDTMRDLSYSHPILNKYRFRESSKKEENKLLSSFKKSKTLPEIRAARSLLAAHESSTTTTDLCVSEALGSSSVQLRHKDLPRKTLMLPSIYMHQGYKAVKRNFRAAPGLYKKDNHLEICDAASYMYIRCRPHQYIGNG